LELSRCPVQQQGPPKLDDAEPRTPESWETETHCSVSLPGEDVVEIQTSPSNAAGNHEPASSTEPPSNDASTPPPVSSPPHRQVSVSVQADGDWCPVDRVRRQILGDSRRPRGRIHIHLLRDSDGHHGETDDHPFVDGRERRRMCDCATCVQHALKIVDTAGNLFAPAPRAEGLRLLSLPGLPTTTADADERRRLAQRLQYQPEKTWVVCGCAVCTTHRNLARAWLRALAVSSTDTPLR